MAQQAGQQQGMPLVALALSQHVTQGVVAGCATAVVGATAGVGAIGGSGRVLIGVRSGATAGFGGSGAVAGGIGISGSALRPSLPIGCC